MKAKALHQNTDRMPSVTVCVTQIMNLGLNNLHFSHLTVNWFHFTPMKDRMVDFIRFLRISMSIHVLFFAPKKLKTVISTNALNRFKSTHKIKIEIGKDGNGN